MLASNALTYWAAPASFRRSGARSFTRNFSAFSSTVGGIPEQVIHEVGGVRERLPPIPVEREGGPDGVARRGEPRPAEERQEPIEVRVVARERGLLGGART